MSEKEENEKGKATKLAEGLADGYESVNNVMTKATGDAIRGAGKLIDETVAGASKGFKEGKNPAEKVGKATVKGGKSIISGTANAIKSVAEGLEDSIKKVSDSVDKTTDAVNPRKSKDKEN